ncbi:MAG: hypothetical protein V3T65_06745 [Acidobacteriota bacterium]
MDTQSVSPDRIALEQREWAEIDDVHCAFGAALHLFSSTETALDDPQIVELLKAVEARFDRCMREVRERLAMKAGKKDAD